MLFVFLYCASLVVVCQYLQDVLWQILRNRILRKIRFIKRFRKASTKLKS